MFCSVFLDLSHFIYQINKYISLGSRAFVSFGPHPTLHCKQYAKFAVKVILMVIWAPDSGVVRAISGNFCKILSARLCHFVRVHIRVCSKYLNFSIRSKSSSRFQFSRNHASYDLNTIYNIKSYD